MAGDGLIQSPTTAVNKKIWAFVLYLRKFESEVWDVAFSWWSNMRSFEQVSMGCVLAGGGVRIVG